MVPIPIPNVHLTVAITTSSNMSASWSEYFQLEELSQLRKIYKEHDGELNAKEFVRQLRAVLKPEYSAGISAEALNHLFMKIDANSDGTVSWDEFVSFLFLSNAENNTDSGHDQNQKLFSLGPHLPAKHSAKHHNSHITVMIKVDGHPEAHDHPPPSKMVLPNKNGVVDGANDAVGGGKKVKKEAAPDTRGDLYLTGSTDGCIYTWESDTLEFHNTLATGLDWIVSAAHMTHTSRLVISSTSRLHIYEVFKDRRKILQSRPVGIVPPQMLRHNNKNASPVCVHYRHEPSTDNEWLFVGCDDGCVTCFIFLDAKNARKAGHVYLDPAAVPHHLNYEDYVDLRHITDLHTDHVTQMLFIEELGCLLTASLDTTLKLIQLDDAGKSHSSKYSRRRVKYTFKGHRKVVRSFAWCSSARLVASCGQARTIKVWAPYSNTHTELKGHKAPVVQVDAVVGKSMLVSLDADTSIKIWDIRTMACVQTIRRAEQPSIMGVHGTMDMIKQILYDEDSGKILTGSYTLALWNPANEDEQDFVDNGSTSDEKERAPLSQILYNSEFRQVVTSSHGGRIVVWDAETGSRVFWFTAYNGDGGGVNVKRAPTTSTADTTDGTQELEKTPMHITAIAFDQHERRLLVGSHVGDAVRIYNFSNGKLLDLLGKVTRNNINDGGGETEVHESLHGMGNAEMRRRHRRSRTRKRMRMKVEQKKKQTDNGISAANNSTNPADLPDASDEISRVIYALASPPSTSRRFSSKVTKIPFILSTGWDRRVHIWLEGDAANEVIKSSIEGEHVTPCSKRIPESDAALTSSIHHSDDVTSLCFCPPETIVTGGYGGLMIGWHVHSGAARFRYKFEHPVEAMCWLGDAVKLLAIGRSQGQIAIFNVDQGYLLEDCDGPFPLDDEVTLLSELACDARGEYVLAGDSSGYIHVWTTMGMASQRSHGCNWLNPFASFRAHRERITSISHVEHTHATEHFVLTASLDGTASMWTLSGMPVGIFGQLNPWDIHNKSTWINGGRNRVNSTPTGNDNNLNSPMQRNHGGGMNGNISTGRSRRQRRKGGAKRDSSARRERLLKQARAGKNSHQHNNERKGSVVRATRRGPRRGSMQTLLDMSSNNGILTVGNTSEVVAGNMGEEDQEADDNDDEDDDDSELEPQMGQVWVRIDDDAEEIVNTITLVRIDPNTNIIVGHDGMFDARELQNGEKPVQIELNYHKMLSHRKRTVRNKAVWRVERNLTACIGRIYKEAQQFHPFKVLFPFLSIATSTALKPDWWVVDTEFVAHRLPEGDLSMAPRSLSMYNMMMLNQQRQVAAAAAEAAEVATAAAAAATDANTQDEDEDIDTFSDLEDLGVGEILLPPKQPKHRGRRSSINHMPDMHRLEHYRKAISATSMVGDGSEGGEVPTPTPPSQEKRSTDVLKGRSRGGLFVRRDLRGVSKQQREASYKRLMKARAETRARKSVKDERIIKNIRDIPIEWHGTESLIEPLEDGPAAWHKSLSMMGSSSNHHGGKHASSNAHQSHGHHHHNHKKKRIKTNFEKSLDNILLRPGAETRW
mgnify:FL=1